MYVFEISRLPMQSVVQSDDSNARRSGCQQQDDRDEATAAMIRATQVGVDTESNLNFPIQSDWAIDGSIQRPPPTEPLLTSIHSPLHQLHHT